MGFFKDFIWGPHDPSRPDDYNGTSGANTMGSGSGWNSLGGNGASGGTSYSVYKQQTVPTVSTVYSSTSTFPAAVQVYQQQQGLIQAAAAYTQGQTATSFINDPVMQYLYNEYSTHMAQGNINLAEHIVHVMQAYKDKSWRYAGLMHVLPGGTTPAIPNNGPEFSLSELDEAMKIIEEIGGAPEQEDSKEPTHV